MQRVGVATVCAKTLLQIMPTGQGVEGTEAMKLCMSKEQLSLYLDPL